MIQINVTEPLLMALVLISFSEYTARVLLDLIGTTTVSGVVFLDTKYLETRKSGDDYKWQ